MEENFILVLIAQKRKLVRIAAVQEILSLMALAELDERGSAWRGVANIRGRLVPIFDPSGPRAPLLPSRHILLCPMGERLIGLIVDEVHDVIALREEALEQCPLGDGRFRQVARLDDEVLPVLEPSDVIHAA